MKFAIGSFLLFVTPAFACPDMAGKWDCVGSDGSHSPGSITQEATPAGLVYHIKDGKKIKDYLADGIVHTKLDGDYTETTQVSCRSDSEVDVLQTAENPKLGFEVKGETKFQRSGPWQLTLDAHIRYKYGGQPQESSMHTICDLQ
jgi:hypothetical protein